jgi:hypothetical protein
MKIFGGKCRYTPPFLTSAQNGDERLASSSDSFTPGQTAHRYPFLITTFHRSRRKHSLYCLGSVFTNPLPSNGCPIVARVGSRGNVFTESLPNNGPMRHNILVSIFRLI